MRTLLPVAVCLSVLFPLVAADIDPRKMEVGDSGPLWPVGKALGLGDPAHYYISEVGDNWLAVRIKSGIRKDPEVTFIVRGVSTKGLVDDREWKPSGTWKVADTEKYRGKTVFTLKPAKD